ncbi:glutamine--fructose-6-phosphate transaminase (isomerizing) [Curtobacterium sp. MCPF17_047]|uniref:glutamine--fructose-6-phosphate transaminase (isomerizing) n=1 Tax=unclassified Curtobacterium TaxID=257496 RepID=UPI000DAABCF9|nr:MULTISPECIES: glutamine--fructose-6-phosphate transaminase (isomerizing) [unclassified Curtobacterium]PZE62300.1 glutamine--fructose-6-phosphate transaminase (isomerizing) [Curtobacterium sp. MCPF17_001]PZF68315.1 glutamine--fructose-6-phosphate transaminase (isomerizing) [Curtobacterium sp. MCPF17_047]
MCGIIAARVADDATPYLLDGLERLEYRGYDSAGIAVRTSTGRTETIRSVSRVGDLRTLVAARSGDPFTGIGIGHTRWATHGAVRETNAHPHADCSGRISVVHNGIIENADLLRAQLSTQGHVFASEVDSEVITHLVERALAVDPDLMLAVQIATAQLEGSWAIVVLDARDGRMVVAADRSPLVVARAARGDFVASDIGAIATWAETFVALRDGDVVELGESWTWSSRGEIVAVPFATPSPFAAEALELGDHADHMAKEIEEQPTVVAEILDRIAGGAVDGSMWRGLGLAPFERVAVVACGTSLNAGQVIATALRGLGGVPTDTVVASEADQAVLTPGTLVVAISQSGETADVLRALDRFADRYQVLALTNNLHSSLARRADAVLDCHAGPEIGVAATKTFTAQVVVGVSAMISALVASSRIDRSRALALVGDMQRLPGLLAGAAEASLDRIPLLVSSVRDASGFLFLGRGAGLPFAAEGALKLKELSYRWAEAYPAGELKHGPLALVTDGTPVVVVDNGEHKIQANVAEVRARGGFVITIGGVGADVPALGRDAGRLLSRRTDVTDQGMSLWGPLESVVPLQMLARELALQLGCDVDKPRNLAKSVTVE